MKAIIHGRYGGPDVLEFRDVERPEPDEGELLIRVQAASVNPLDWHFLTGTPYLVRLVAGLRRPKQRVRGADVAGRVEAVGPGVDGWAPGDRVYGIARGSFAEYTVAPAERVAPIPESLSDAQAAALPIAAVTARQGLRDHARLRPGQSVLIIGAAGGVGTSAIQIAVAMGADVTGVCSTRNVDLVRSLGASRVVDYTREDFVADGTRYDVIVDNVGDRSLRDCRRALADDGTYVMISGPKDNPWVDPFRRLLAARLRFLFGSQRIADFTASESTAELLELNQLVQAGHLRPAIDRHYPLCDVADAIRYVATGHARAKVIIDVAPDPADTTEAVPGEER